VGWCAGGGQPIQRSLGAKDWTNIVLRCLMKEELYVLHKGQLDFIRDEVVQLGGTLHFTRTRWKTLVAPVATMIATTEATLTITEQEIRTI